MLYSFQCFFVHIQANLSDLLLTDRLFFSSGENKRIFYVKLINYFLFENNDSIESHTAMIIGNCVMDFYFLKFQNPANTNKQ